MATWPASLPVIQRKGHQHSKARGSSSVQFAAGNRRYRRMLSEPIETFAVSWVMTETQLNTFIAFWKGDGDFGAADIDGMKIKDHNGITTSGSGGAPSLRFVEVFEPERIGIERWRMRAEVERVSDHIESLASYMDGAYINWENSDRMLWENGDYIVWD